ncbi:phospholipase A and acyltransferase 4-like [Pagrus major]|uniref:phospholipase A and acyltransferase 4-like n=1 Tax=Pagrus major TaxID=143350 RepID=UPI003CC8768C
MNQSQSKSDQKPKPGDLIEIFRGVYEHWAVYVGNGWVVHVTSPPGAKESGAVSKSLMSVSTEKAMVRKQKLQEVVGDSKWTINNSLDKMYESRSPCIIVEEALRQVGKRMKYSVISKNCEHFATKLRYGKAKSWQVVQASFIPVVGAIVDAVDLLHLLSGQKTD